MNVLEKILEELENESQLAHEEMRRCASLKITKRIYQCFANTTNYMVLDFGKIFTIR